MRVAILDAAASLVAERGYHAVRVADIAQAVGISSGSVHYYFSGKHDVLTEALVRAVDRAHARQRAALAQVPGAYQKLLKLIDMQLPRPGTVRDEWSIWMQFWAEASFRPELRPYHRQSYAHWFGQVRQIIELGQDQGVFQADMDAEVVARRLTAMVDGLGVQAVAGSPITVTSMRDVLVSFIDETLLADPTA
jgi:AcrR family transcriptional regulator